MNKYSGHLVSPPILLPSSIPPAIQQNDRMAEIEISLLNQRQKVQMK